MTGEDGDESRGEKRALGGAVFVLAFVGTFVTQYLSGAYQSPDRAIGLVAGSALVGLASALPVGVVLLLPFFQTLQHGIARYWQRVLPVLLAAVVVAVTVPVLGPWAGRLTNEWWGCDPSREFTVVTTPAVRNTANELLRDFEAATAVTNDGCPTGHGFVYDSTEDEIVKAVGDGWAVPPDKTSDPLRDVGPRPDVWLTESTLPVNRVSDYGGRSAEVKAHSFGLTRVVLAIPPGAPRPTDGSPLLDLIASQPEGVVRPDPAKSTVGLLATAALYDAPVDTPSPTPIDDDRKKADLAVEEGLGVAAGRFPGSDEGSLLCRFRAETGPRPALLLSEQAVERFNEGELVGGPCPRDDTAPAFLRAVYPQAAVLDHQVVRLRWSEGAASPGVADDFVAWLTSPAGQDAVRSTRLLPTTAGDKVSDNLVERGVLDAKAVGDVRLRYVAAHRPRRVLLALDSSGSMGRTNRDQKQTRAEIVKRAVAEVCPGREKDEIGLWAFPDASDRRPRPVTPLSANGCNAVRDAAAALEPGGNTPLLQTLLDGVDALAGTDDKAERRLVVVTDGEDTSVGVAPDDVLGKLSDAKIKVNVVTLGDITCAAYPLQEVADATGGQCFDPGYTAGQVRDAVEG